jgi:RecB family exonuclease
LLEQWLRNEIFYSESGPMRPVFTEREFGRGSDLMPMEIEGKQVFLTGKIDRIDRAGNTFYITDYKSGQVPKKAAFLDTNLQLPLYILAADRLVAAKEGGTVTGGGYYVLKAGERQENFLFANAQDGSLPWQTYSDITDTDGTTIPVTDITVLREKTEQVLADTLQRMEQGDFRPTPSKDCHANCPAAKICRYSLLKPGRDGEEGHE